MSHWSDKYTDEQLATAMENELPAGIANERNEFLEQLLDDAYHAGVRQYYISPEGWRPDNASIQTMGLAHRLAPDFERPGPPKPELKVYKIEEFSGWSVFYRIDDERTASIQTDGSDERFAGYVFDDEVTKCHVYYTNSKGKTKVYDGCRISELVSGRCTKRTATHIAIWEAPK